MRSTPRSTALRSTRLASSRSGGSPQMPLPVIRMAPTPSRWTSRSPPIVNVPLAWTGLSDVVCVMSAPSPSWPLVCPRPLHQTSAEARDVPRVVQMGDIPGIRRGIGYVTWCGTTPLRELRGRLDPYRWVMDTRNPVLAREATQYATFGKQSAAPADATPEQLQEMYDAPTAPGRLGRVVEGDRALTIHDVIVRTAAMFVVLVAAAAVSWNLVEDNPWIVWVSLVAALVLGIVNSVKRVVSVPLILLYAAVEGVFLGGLSWLYDDVYGTGAGNANIVGQAVIGTLFAFGVMLALYASGRLRATPRFKKMMMIALVSYLAIAVVSLISALFGVGEGWGFYGVGGLGILLCVAGVGLAAFSLVLDFDAIERMIAAGAPEREAWRMAFGLVVTLVWLYLELLRLLAILQGRN